MHLADLNDNNDRISEKDYTDKRWNVALLCPKPGKPSKICDRAQSIVTHVRRVEGIRICGIAYACTYVQDIPFLVHIRYVGYNMLI